MRDFLAMIIAPIGGLVIAALVIRDQKRDLERDDLERESKAR